MRKKGSENLREFQKNVETEDSKETNPTFWKRFKVTQSWKFWGNSLMFGNSEKILRNERKILKQAIWGNFSNILEITWGNNYVIGNFK